MKLPWTLLQPFFLSQNTHVRWHSYFLAFFLVGIRLTNQNRIIHTSKRRQTLTIYLENISIVNTCTKKPWGISIFDRRQPPSWVSLGMTLILNPSKLTAFHVVAMFDGRGPTFARVVCLPAVLGLHSSTSTLLANCKASYHLSWYESTVVILHLCSRKEA